ncbi:MAG: hypothetical protein MJ188_09695 [Treponema sp.]|nr:hypothetical protein [Treponema sp.]
MKKQIAFSIFSLLFIFSLYAQTNKPMVTDIQAQWSGNSTKINVYWTLPVNPKPEIKKLYLYRATRPITSFSQIKNVEPLVELSPEATGYVDKVSDFKDYYYAVLAYTNKLNDFILTSMNATVSGVHINPVEENSRERTNGSNGGKREKLYLDGNIRETPLPYIDYVEGLNQEQQISNETVKSTSQFKSNEAENTVAETKLYIFEEDLFSPDGGDDFLLFEILKTTLIQEKYEEAIKQLDRLVNRNISKEVQQRAIFYKAEAHYFIGSYGEAVKNFIQVSQYYPLETKKWINLSLDRMKIEN